MHSMLVFMEASHPDSKFHWVYVHFTSGRYSTDAVEWVQQQGMRLLLLDNSTMQIWAPLLAAAPALLHPAAGHLLRKPKKASRLPLATTLPPYIHLAL